jgi:hypothetical protein
MPEQRRGGANPLIARRRVARASDSLAATEQKLQEETTENRRAYERFYNNLALFSGGAIALSITYLGYLRTLRGPVPYRTVLFAGWTSLAICLICSLLWTFFSSHHLHYARQGEIFEKQAGLRRAEAGAPTALPIVGVHSETEREQLFRRLLEDADRYRRIQEWAAGRARLYLVAYKWGGRASRFAFATGIVLLIWFAIANS